jgi:sulfur carrier protein
MQLIINGRPQDVPAGTTVAAVVAARTAAGTAVAVAVNETFVPRGRYAQTELNEGDQLELVAPMAGG